MSGLGPRRITAAAAAAFGILILTVLRPFPPEGQIVSYALLLGALLAALAMPSFTSVAVTAAQVTKPRSAPTTHARPASPTAKVDPAVALKSRWTAACKHHSAVLSAYGAYELDPAMLLQYPALWDLSAQPVMDFHDALDLAGGLQSDAYPADPSDAQDYADAVDILRSAWTKADRFARTTGTDQLAEPDARDCRRALKLLRHADGTTGQERASYLGQVITTVDRLTNRGVVSAVPKISEELATRVQLAIEA